MGSTLWNKGTPSGGVEDIAKCEVWADGLAHDVAITRCSIWGLAR